MKKNYTKRRRNHKNKHGGTTVKDKEFENEFLANFNPLSPIKENEEVSKMNNIEYYKNPSLKELERDKKYFEGINIILNEENNRLNGENNNIKNQKTIIINNDLININNEIINNNNSAIELLKKFTEYKISEDKQKYAITDNNINQLIKLNYMDLYSSMIDNNEKNKINIQKKNNLLVEKTFTVYDRNIKLNIVKPSQKVIKPASSSNNQKHTMKQFKPIPKKSKLTSKIRHNVILSSKPKPSQNVKNAQVKPSQNVKSIRAKHVKPMLF